MEYNKITSTSTNFAMLVIKINPDLDAGPGLVDDHVGVGQDEAVTLHDEPRPVADCDRLARVVVPHAAILGL